MARMRDFDVEKAQLKIICLYVRNDGASFTQILEGGPASQMHVARGDREAIILPEISERASCGEMR